MASGSSNRPNSGSKAFDFASDDILCSYEDYVNQNNSDGTHSDQSLPNPTQDFQKSRISRSSVFPTTNVYSQPDESLNQELLSTVERTMKKYADNLMRFLEGISSRLSQLELYCYNLDKSIGEMRSDLSRDHGDADSKLKFLEKHLQEVHRSVQILRDKQELAETQKELAKLQFAQKESSSSSQEERTVASAPENKKNDDVSDTPNTQLALALPSQIPAQPTPPQPATQPVSQLQPYYLPSQLPNPQNHSQTPYLQPDPQYRVPQPPQSQVNPTLHSQQYPQYQQQWSQQVSQPMPPPQQPQMPPLPQQPPMQPGQQPPPSQMRPPSPQSQVYPPYMANQPSNPPPEAMGSSMPTQAQFPGSQQSGGSRPDSMLYGYGGPSARPVGATQPSPQHIKGGFPAHQGDGYPTGGSHPPPMSSGGTYMLYDGSQPTHYSQSGYPSANPSVPNMPPPNNNSLIIRSPAPQQYVRNHPYNELIDKLVSMGYRADHVVSVIQRLEESGQSVDFNAVLDRLNGHSSGSSQRSW